jgi:hypothetical protein
MGVKTVEALVAARLNAVLAKPMDEIRLLPDFITDEAAFEGGVVKLTTYHETLDGDVHRLIVQATRPAWRGLINKVIAEGYEVSGAGSPRKLKPEELYAYT